MHLESPSLLATSATSRAAGRGGSRTAVSVAARTIVVLASIAALAGCSAHKPVLYPNQKLTQVGQAAAERDIAECQQLAEEYVKSGGADSELAGRAARNTAVGAGTGAAAGAVGGAIGGNPGEGAAIGAATGATAGLVGTFFDNMFSESQPDPTYANFVNRCLSERGYEVIGWE